MGEPLQLVPLHGSQRLHRADVETRCAAVAHHALVELIGLATSEVRDHLLSLLQLADLGVLAHSLDVSSRQDPLPQIGPAQKS